MNTQKLSQLFLRFALAAGFLSAVADRFGLWGAPGSPQVAWGNFANFQGYVGLLNSFAPAALIPALAWIATIAEVVLALLLIVGYKLKWVSLLSGLMLTTFFVTMTFALGVKSPLDYSVFTCAAAAFYLYATTRHA